MGQTIAAFENEPANINAMGDAFPAAALVYLDTIHSKKPDVPGPNTSWIRDFESSF
ncbi:MAG: hypothetical protein HY537_10775 [Deltaproteobacteria bacterium]|nr:hypothetical protein [Deltaproteobacteria bacterium]